jgi:two-component system chemotaxis sensor kinase CheA
MTADPYKYFRVEARELLEGMSAAVLTLEKGPAGGDLLARLLRQAHTLKGAARVVRLPEIAELAHRIEDLLAPHRDGATAPSRETVDGALRTLDAIAAALAPLEAASAPAPAAPAPLAPTATSEPVATDRFAAAAAALPSAVTAPPPEAALDSVRIEIHALDALLHEVAEAAAGLTALRATEGVLARARRLAEGLVERLSAAAGPSPGKAAAGAAELSAVLEQLERGLGPEIDRVEGELRQLRTGVDELRLLPVSAVFGPLDRAVRDAARTTGKAVELETIGGAHRADANVLSALRDALLHVVRNAVAHGIETAAERKTAGKPAAGRVRLEVERRGGRLVFRCSDDGRGIDVDAVRRSAVRRGLVTADAAAALSLDEAVRLIFRPGVSSVATITELSGRGVGLDVVRATAERLKGRVAVRSERGRGTTVEIDVPLTLASLAVLSVEAAGTAAAIPLDAVVRTARIADAEIARSAGGATVVDESGPVPFVPLAALLGGSSLEAHGGAWPVVFVRSSAGTAAVGVDRLLGIAETAVRPLPDAVGSIAVVAGVQLEVGGACRILLDPAGLVEAAERARPERLAATPVRRAPVLVIDDSLTTRMLEQSILESAGYEVDLAVSGEDGLEKARRRRYGLFVVDVEMPGMDGFAFIEQAHADPALAAVPAMLVTSRGSPEDRRRGAEVGARSYMVKSEFDQGKLLQTIRGLIG